MTKNIIHLIILNWKSALTTALISIPLSLSLAVASGVAPIVGIITALWAGLIASIFGSSNYNIIGPTGALSGLIASYTMLYGASVIPTLAVMVGLIIMIAYFFKFERYLIFIPASVIHGFTLGVACIIAFGQINAALGLHLQPHQNLLTGIVDSFAHIMQSSVSTFIVFLIFFIALFVLRRLLPTIPGAIILSPIGILLGYLTTGHIIPYKLETLEQKFGSIQATLIQIPVWKFSTELILPAITIALIAMLETLLSAKIADGMTKTKHSSHQELFGLGLANIITGLVGGMPATAALARTALNIKSGATHKISAALNSIFIMIGSYIFLSSFTYMPMAVIAAILVYVAVNMIEREHFVRLFQINKPHFLIALLVACITIVHDPILGILIGALIALLLLVRTIAQSHHTAAVHTAEIQETKKHTILVYTFKGELVYMNGQGHLARFENAYKEYYGVILNFEQITFIDLDGIDTINEIIMLLKSRNQTVAIVCSDQQIIEMLKHAHSIHSIIAHNLIFANLPEALKSLHHPRAYLNQELSEET